MSPVKALLLLATVLSIAGCVAPRSRGVNATREPLGAQDRTLALQFLRALYAPAHTKYYIIADPNADAAMLAWIPIHRRRGVLQSDLLALRSFSKKLLEVQIERGDASPPVEDLYVSFDRGTGRLCELPPALRSQIPDVSLDLRWSGTRLVDLTCYGCEDMFRGYAFHLRPHEHAFRYAGNAALD